MNFLYIFLIIYLIPLIAYIIMYLMLNKYNDIEISGFEVARNILDKHQLDDMYIVEKKGYFTDVFDTKQNVIRLSSPVFHNDSVYSLAISSYFATKAFLFNEGVKSVKFKLLIDNFIKILTNFVYLLLLVGIVLNSFPTYKVVLILFVIILLYNILTIPIEDKITKNSIKELVEKKYISKGDKDIKTIYTFMKVYGIAQMVIALSNLYYNIKEDIKK